MASRAAVDAAWELYAGHKRSCPECRRGRMCAERRALLDAYADAARAWDPLRRGETMQIPLESCRDMDAYLADHRPAGSEWDGQNVVVSLVDQSDEEVICDGVR